MRFGFEFSNLLIMGRRIRNFTDLEVYQSTYEASVIVLTEIIPKLPKCEQFDLADQLRRSVKAIPRLIAEGFAKRHQKKGFQKYLDDAAGESNETIVSLNHAKDIYNVEPRLITDLIDLYDKASRQLYNLSVAWYSFAPRKRKEEDQKASPFVTENR